MVFFGISWLKCGINFRPLRKKTDYVIMVDKDLTILHQVKMYTSGLGEWSHSPVVLNEGVLLYCLSGEAELQVNFEQWRLTADHVIILFPGDVVLASGHFSARLLCYDSALLREASLQMEHTVYTLLRADRCKGDRPVVASVVKNMMGLLQVFFDQPNCQCLDQMVLLQLKMFFLGFSDFLQRNPQRRPQELGSERVNGLFSEFMRLVAEHYREQRDVAYYAFGLHISPKYLGMIVNRKTGRNPKTIIDHYVIVQLKLQLRTSRITIKELAWLYHFSDSSFFCRYFKSHTGLSPQEYRKDKAAD